MNEQKCDSCKFLCLKNFSGNEYSLFGSSTNIVSAVYYCSEIDEYIDASEFRTECIHYSKDENITYENTYSKENDYEVQDIHSLDIDSDVLELIVNDAYKMLNNGYSQEEVLNNLMQRDLNENEAKYITNAALKKVKSSYKTMIYGAIFFIVGIILVVISYAVNYSNLDSCFLHDRTYYFVISRIFKWAWILAIWGIILFFKGIIKKMIR